MPVMVETMEGDTVNGGSLEQCADFSVKSTLNLLVAACDCDSPVTVVGNGIRLARSVAAALSVTNERVDPGSIIALTVWIRPLVSRMT